MGYTVCCVTRRINKDVTTCCTRDYVNVNSAKVSADSGRKKKISEDLAQRAFWLYMPPSGFKILKFQFFCCGHEQMSKMLCLSISTCVHVIVLMVLIPLNGLKTSFCFDQFFFFFFFFFCDRTFWGEFGDHEMLQPPLKKWSLDHC